MTCFPTADFFGGRGFIGTNSVKLSWINLKSTGTYMKHMKQRLASAHINDNDDPLIFHAWLEENSWCYKGKNNLARKPRSSLQDRCFIRPLRQYSLHFPISAFWGGKIAKQTHKQNLTGKYNHSPVCSRPDQLNPVLTLLLCVMHSKLIRTSSRRNGKPPPPQKKNQDPTGYAAKWNEVERILSTSIESDETYDENIIVLKHLEMIEVDKNGERCWGVWRKKN